MYLSDAKENTASQKPGKSLHILRYVTDNIPPCFPAMTCARANYFPASGCKYVRTGARQTS